MAEYISQRYVNMQVLYPINSIMEIYSVYTVILQDGIILGIPTRHLNDGKTDWVSYLCIIMYDHTMTIYVKQASRNINNYSWLCLYAFDANNTKHVFDQANWAAMRTLRKNKIS